jgi:hypothetical protein
VKVFGLPTIIAIKEELKGEKDVAVLSILRRTLEEKKRPGSNQLHRVESAWQAFRAHSA